MLADFISHIASHAGVTTIQARAALGIVLNAADRQGAECAREIFERVPGARTLAARMGAETGAATGVIARLIEQTPGGRAEVAASLIRALHDQGLGHAEVAAVFPAISSFAESEFGVRGLGHLGDVLGAGPAPVSESGVSVV
ncbi:MAG: hypothetical protein R3C52_07390 [Hyphomonadaceae bacterium]